MRMRVNVHARCTHTHAHHPSTHTRTHAHTHARTHARTPNTHMYRVQDTVAPTKLKHCRAQTKPLTKHQDRRADIYKRRAFLCPHLNISTPKLKHCRAQTKPLTKPQDCRAAFYKRRGFLCPHLKIITQKISAAL